MKTNTFSPESHSIVIDGVEIEYQYTAPLGSASTVVFLPGLFAGGWMWRPQAELVASLGYGTLSIVEPYAKLALGAEPIARFRAALELLLERHEILRPLLCGNSLGGLVAIDYGVNGVRDSYVLGSGVPGIGKITLPGIGVNRTPTDADMRTMLEGIFHDHSNIKPEMIGLAASCFDQKHFKNLIKYLLDVRKYAIIDATVALKGRLTLVWGAQDLITPTELWKQTFKTSIERGDMDFVQIEGCGHSPMLEDAAAFNKHLEEICERHMPMERQELFVA